MLCIVLYFGEQTVLEICSIACRYYIKQWHSWLIYVQSNFTKINADISHIVKISSNFVIYISANTRVFP